MTVMPAQVTVAPAPVPPVPVMSPTHLLRLEAVHFCFGGQCGTRPFGRGRQPFILRKRLRHKRRGLRAHSSQSGRTGGNSKSKFQKVAAFHDISLFGFG
jgi:hypothetical protein